MDCHPATVGAGAAGSRPGSAMLLAAWALGQLHQPGHAVGAASGARKGVGGQTGSKDCYAHLDRDQPWASGANQA